MVGMMEVERVCKRCRRAKVYSITLALAAAKVCEVPLLCIITKLPETIK